MHEKLDKKESGKAIKSKSRRTWLLHFNIFFWTLVLAPNYLIAALYKDNYKASISSTTHAHSNEALWVLIDCENRAESRHEDRVMKATEKRDKDLDLTDKWETLALVAVGIYGTFFRVDTNGVEIPIEKYYDAQRKSINRTLDYEILASSQKLNADEYDCEKEARKLDEDLRYVDEAERNIHFEFGSGEIQYGLLNTAPTPNTNVSVELIR